MIEEAVVAHLTGETSASDRVYPAFLTEGWAAPAIRYQLVSDVRDSAMGEDTGLCTARIQFDCLATTYAAAAALRAAVRTRWQRFRGTVAGVEIEDAFIENQSGGFDEPSGYHACTVDVRILYKE